MFKKILLFIISRKFLINVILIICTWIIIIWVTFKYFEKFTEFGNEIIVPNLIGNNIKDVPSLLIGTSLKYQIIDSVYNPELLEGSIIFQSPLPTDSSGMRVKTGRTIKLRLTKNTKMVESPIVISKSLRFAEGVLQSKGFRTKISLIPNNEYQGSVIDQKFRGKSLSKGNKIPVNAIIELVVGRKSVDEFAVVPNLTGLTIRDAKAVSSKLELLVIYSNCKNEQDSLDARIFSQNPIGDSSKLPYGSKITVFATPNKSE